MAQARVDASEHFKSLLGQHPKRARVGYGSFLTFDFGHASKRDHRLWYEWQLRIQNSDWRIADKSRNIVIVDSESKSGPMQAAVARLETKTLDRVVHNPKTCETRFVFSGPIELFCKAYADAEDDEDCWALYTPDSHVLLADSAGRLRYVRSDIPEPTPSSSRHRNHAARA